MSRFSRTLLASALAIPFFHTTTYAKEDHEHHEHGAHQHGVAQLNLAVSGTAVEIELETPAANIVGFEHQPTSEADHHAVEEAVAVLKKGETLFRFSPAASCQLVSSNIESPLMVDSDEMEHNDHDHEAHHEEHQETDDEHDEDHEREQDETHSEFHAHYHFNCPQADQLNQLQVDLFDAFPATLHLNVQYLFNEKQGAVEMEADQRKIRF